MSNRLGVAQALLSLLGVCLAFLAWGQGSAAGSSASPAAASASSEQHFDINEYRVVGNTVLPGRDIERLLYPRLGPGKTLADVESARAALEKVYHDQGYGTVFVDIPPQTVNDGIVRLRVTEGRVERTQISGARYFAERDVIAQLPATKPGTVLQISELQKELGAVNSATPDRSVVPVLKAGSAPGTVDLALKVNDTLPLHGSLELNNQATIDTRELRAIASLSYGNLFGRLDSISMQFQFTPQQFSQVNVFAMNYVAHIRIWTSALAELHQFEQQRARRGYSGRARHRRHHQRQARISRGELAHLAAVGQRGSGLQAFSQHHQPECDHRARYADQLHQSVGLLFRPVALGQGHDFIQPVRQCRTPRPGEQSLILREQSLPGDGRIIFICAAISRP